MLPGVLQISGMQPVGDFLCGSQPATAKSICPSYQPAPRASVNSSESEKERVVNSNFFFDFVSPSNTRSLGGYTTEAMSIYRKSAWNCAILSAYPFKLPQTGPIPLSKLSPTGSLRWV